MGLFTWFSRLAGHHRIPSAIREELSRERIWILEEDLRGVLHMDRFSAPGKHAFHRLRTFRGALVLSDLRFMVFVNGQKTVHILRTQPIPEGLALSSRGPEGQLCITLSSPPLNQDWKGKVTLCINSRQSERLLSLLPLPHEQEPEGHQAP